MNLLGKIFGSEKVIEKTFNGIDKAIYTKEEKSNTWLSMLKSYEPFKLAQRLISLSITLCYLLLVIFACVMLVIDDRVSKELFTIINSSLSTPFIIIISFYFGGGAIEGIVNKIKK